MTDSQTTLRDIKLTAAIHAIKGYCSATPQAITPTSDTNELLGAWNRWNERLQDHYIPEPLIALEGTE